MVASFTSSPRRTGPSGAAAREVDVAVGLLELDVGMHCGMPASPTMRCTEQNYTQRSRHPLRTVLAVLLKATTPTVMKAATSPSAAP